MKKTNKIKLILLGLSLLITGGFFLQGCSVNAGKQKVKVEVNIPLSGPIANWSGQFPNGYKMGIEDACKKYNVDPNVFKVNFQDNAGDATQAISAYQKEKLDGFDVFISVSTIPVNAFANQVDQTGKPHFIASFDPFVTQGGPNRFRVMANSKIEAPLLVDYALSQNAKKIYVVQLNFPYAEEEFGKIVQPQLEAKGVTVIRERFEVDQRDFKTIVAKIKAENPDIVYICGYSFHVQPFIRDLRSADLVKKGKVVSVMDFVDLLYGGTQVEELKDVVFVCPLFDIPGKVEGGPEWRARYEQLYKMKPTYVPAYAYDNATMIVKAYAESAGVVNTETLKKTVPFSGVNGTINLDADRDIMSTITLATLDDSGKIEEVILSK
jgi:branched-chain amino acid transport system substrate-binding protein